VGRAEGLEEAKLVALAAWRDASAFTAAERAALALADAMSDTPATVPEGLWRELRDHFTEPQLVELTAAIAWENYRSRFNRTFDFEAEGFSAGAFCPLPLGSGSGRDGERS
jgi:alkylhydroperoxidase family enzyme